MRTDPVLAAPSDATLVDEVAATIAVPRARPADSFVLHAPLELLARAALLPLVEPDGRDEARDRLVDLATSFRAFSEGVDDALPPQGGFAGTHEAVAALRGALELGAVDEADAAATWLAERLDAASLADALADPVLPLLSGAAHGSIFLYHLPRVAPRSHDAARMLRSLIREVARHPGWELSWFRHLPEDPAPRPDAAGALADRLRRPPSPGRPDNDFIYPMMSLTEGSGLAHDLLHDVVGLPVAEARRVLLRTAAMSMLQDDAAHAPYGWSHCLTMPQATLGVAGACATPWHAVAVAATYVLGFRSIHGQVALDPTWVPEPTDAVDLLAMFDAGPAAAAATAWHTAVEQRPALRSRLATHAAAHHDAHLVKYTLACIDAAHADPPAEALYLAAAAHLGGWWAALDGARPA